MERSAKKTKKMGLTTRIFIALLAGVAFGVALCYLVPDGSFKNDILVEGVLYVVGQGFIRLMKMLVVPLVFVLVQAFSRGLGVYWEAVSDTFAVRAAAHFSSSCPPVISS